MMQYIASRANKIEFMKKLIDSLVVISLVLSVGCSTSVSSIGRIGFVGSHGSDQSTYLVTASGRGTQVTEIVKLGESDQQTIIVARSQEGRLAQFDVNSGTLSIGDVSGKNLHFLAKLGQHGASSISWSSDGKKILLSGNGINVVNTTTGEITKFNINTSEDSGNFLTGNLAVFSPDGLKIAFIGTMVSLNPFTRNSIGVYTMGADGGNVKELVIIDTFGRGPLWSPNGLQILYGNDDDVFIVDVTTGISLNLTDNSNGIYADEYSWSPDGKTIAFSQHGVGASGVYTLDSEGKNLRKVADSISQASWYDNYRILAARRVSDDPRQPINVGLVMVAIDGSNIETILPDCKYYQYMNNPVRLPR